MAIETISVALARRIALAAQGFGAPRPETPGPVHLRRTIDRLNLLQIDSVIVLARRTIFRLSRGSEPMTGAN